MQYKWYRKWKGGSYYLIWNWLPMGTFWSDKLITSCGGRAIKEEHYKKKSQKDLTKEIEDLKEQIALKDAAYSELANQYSHLLLKLNKKD